MLFYDKTILNKILYSTYTFSKDYQHLQIYTSKDKIFGSHVSTHCKFLFVVCLLSPESNFSAGPWKMRLNDIKLYVHARARVCVCVTSASNIPISKLIFHIWRYVKKKNKTLWWKTAIILIIKTQSLLPLLTSLEHWIKFQMKGGFSL